MDKPYYLRLERSLDCATSSEPATRANKDSERQLLRNGTMGRTKALNAANFQQKTRHYTKVLNVLLEVVLKSAKEIAKTGRRGVQQSEVLDVKVVSFVRSYVALQNDLALLSTSIASVLPDLPSINLGSAAQKPSRGRGYREEAEVKRYYLERRFQRHFSEN